MIKYIIFDLADVLITGTNETGFALAKKHQLAVDDRQSFPLLTPLAQDFFHGHVREDEYIDEVIRTYPQFGSKDWLKQHIRENFTEVPGTREIVLRLKGLGYPLALLSVHAKEWIEYCDQKFKIHEVFDQVAYSFTDKVSKPNKKAFELVLARLNAQPEECLFIDDTLVNIQTAEEMGIKSVQFFNASKLNEQLKVLLPDYQ